MAAPACILVVEHNPCNLDMLRTLIEQEGYQVLGATTLEEFDQALAGVMTIRLTLVDVEGFDRSIWARCEALRMRGIPFLVIALETEVILRQESYQHGASGVLMKPLIIKEFVTVLGNLLEVKA
jgi:DNA-binding response OmpR family regulator